MTLTFGIYPGGLGVTDDDSITQGPPEDPAKITAALDALKILLVRGYVHFVSETDHSELLMAPPNPVQYATGSRRLDLVACFREPGTDLTGWIAFLRSQLRTHGSKLASLQVTEEANHAGPGGDGRSPAVRDALVTGVIEAKREAVRLGLDVKIGCNSTLDFSPDQEFWTDLGKRGGDEFRESLDYAGLDFFPDVFHPIPADRLAVVVAGALTGFRTNSLAAAGIPDTTPIHITEHGWGTGPGRPGSRQAEVLDLVINLVAEHSRSLNISVYEHFALRDADSSHPDPLFQLGLVRSDYTPKPAFDTFRRLITTLGRPL